MSGSSTAQPTGTQAAQTRAGALPAGRAGAPAALLKAEDAAGLGEATASLGLGEPADDEDDRDGPKPSRPALPHGVQRAPVGAEQPRT
ncbi:hypothetical protein [Streptomyces sp. NBC_00316]|uniref:hypothetical protein n=1 Tax=Streptomyces sp. NBC_00316 TaxID=2975710 RepID=UPI002E2D2AEC|nr:hypothetical protein [Streptomyces sp. NBC_00316]